MRIRGPGWVLRGRGPDWLGGVKDLAAVAAALGVPTDAALRMPDIGLR